MRKDSSYTRISLLDTCWTNEQGARMSVGFSPDEIDTSAPTRSARLKWVVVVNEALPAGLAVNAAICAAAATSPAISGLLGDGVDDADGNWHPGLPWAGCS